MPKICGDTIVFDLKADMESHKYGVPAFLMESFVPMKDEKLKAALRAFRASPLSTERKKKIGAVLRELRPVLEDNINTFCCNSMGLLYKSGNVIVSAVCIWEFMTQWLRTVKWEGPILIYGERGTGKELVARMIQGYGARADKDFVKVNCAAIPKDIMLSEIFGHKKGAFTGSIEDHDGYLKQADRGVLFLDEIHHLSLEAQAALLRVLDDEGSFRPIGSPKDDNANVHLIAATNVPVKELLKKKEDGGFGFLPDLFDRINGMRFIVPSLLQRHENDKKALATHFILQALKKHKLGKPRLDMPLPLFNLLWGTNYEGNIRELRYRCETSVHDTLLNTNRNQIYESFLGELSPGTRRKLLNMHKGMVAFLGFQWETQAVSSSNTEKSDHPSLPPTDLYAPYRALLDKPLFEAEKEAKKLFTKEWLAQKKKENPGKSQKEIAITCGFSQSTFTRKK